jgi:hypothetical protein
MRGLLLALVPLALAAHPCRAPRAGAGEAPSLVVWAWERPEDLSYAPRDVGVAFLRSTVRLSGEEVMVVPRRQPLRVADGAYVTAVIRVEASRRAPPALDTAQRRRIVDEAERAAQIAAIRGVQIDFDAPRSLRPAYKALLRELRAALPPRIELTMTALASWCMGDRWLDEGDLAVADVVPMVFQMGSEGAAVRRAIDDAGDLRASACRSSVGVALSEPWPKLSPRRRYVFASAAWTERALAGVLARVEEDG